MRVLISCVPSEGHFRPLLPLAHALAAAGHEIAFATAEAWAPQVSAEGFVTLPAGMSEQEVAARRDEYEPPIDSLPIPQRRMVRFTRTFALVGAPAKLPGLIAAAESWRADLIMWDSADVAAPIAAAVLGLRSANHSFGELLPLALLERVGELVEPLWRAHGLAPEPYAGSFRDLYIDNCPPAMRSTPDEPPVQRIVMRPATAEVAEPSPWLAELGRPLAYVTLGTVFNAPALFKPLLEGIDGEAAALVTIGRSSDPDVLGPLPARVRVEQFVAQSQVLPFCDVVVSHGGSGTMLGALAHGLPLLLVPSAANQFDNAAKAKEAGAAIVLLPDEVTPDAVRGGLRALLTDGSYRACAKHVEAEIAGMSSPTEAASALERAIAD
jgi:UDP:flavonoid glycosyltransferase YjiC (YdhE family)